MQLFTPFKVKQMEIRNRIVLPPMDLYSAGTDGKSNDVHFVHYVSRAAGGVGLIIMEATAVTPRGRISDRCLGLWDDGQVEGLRSIVDACRSRGAKMAIQLNHAGRKCAASEPFIHAPSPIAFSGEYQTPREISKDEISEAVGLFRAAAARAASAGFDALELHGAHGYLISEFLSPLTNKRTDEYGGSIENRCRFLLEVLRAVKDVWPEEKPLLVRVSAKDYLDEGNTPEDMVRIVELIKQYVDVIDVSSGGIAMAPIKPYPGYQVPLARKIREECGMPVITVGLITDVHMVEEILCGGSADLVAMGRELFRNPHWVLNAAREYGMEYPWPSYYKEAFEARK
ncbi:MAG: NADPH dehydrogenase NamA [Bacillota bacterium]